VTKAGRIAPTEFDYSPAWIRASVLRSLERLNTTYLDLVYTHDGRERLDEAAKRMWLDDGHFLFSSFTFPFEFPFPPLPYYTVMGD
ncbi:L-galactose dehydrogenase, partial [Colletotrichum filicis]